jgi:glutamate synthase (NADPH) small chain
LSFAADLAKAGYQVTIFEAFHVPCGVLLYGIPEVRLPKALVQKEIDAVKQLGVTIRTNMVIGRVLSLVDLTVEGYEGILIGSGAGLPSFMKIPGENLNGVYLLTNFWLVLTLMKAYSSQKRIDPSSRDYRRGRNGCK